MLTAMASLNNKNVVLFIFCLIYDPLSVPLNLYKFLFIVYYSKIVLQPQLLIWQLLLYVMQIPNDLRLMSLTMAIVAFRIHRLKVGIDNAIRLRTPYHLGVTPPAGFVIMA